ncbi:MAG: outer membrane beta-barrel protein [Nitrospira sp.]|nr:outer membrane beta-barrel protein [Nitrospira sp.]
MSGLCCTIVRYSLAVVMLVFVLFSSPAQAEWYVAGQAGATFNGYFGHIAGTTGNAAGLDFSQLGLQNSVLYGGKVGYYLDDPGFKWLGVEMEVFTSTPNIKQQAVTINDGGNTTVELTRGQDVRVTNFSPFSVMFRYQIGRLEPYAGGGLGIYFINTHDAQTNTSSSDNGALGFIAKAGLRWMVTDHLALFGEWKYNQVKYNYDSMPIGSTDGGGQAQYRSYIAVGGIGWHF